MKVDKSKWVTKPISSFFNLQMGKTPSRKLAEVWKDGEIPWVSIADMKNKKYISSTKEMLPIATIEQCNIPLVPENTVIMSFKLTIGKTCITRVPLTTNEAIMAFYPKGYIQVDNSFLSYALSAISWKGNRAVKGLTINKKVISDQKLTLPSFEIQQSIASELDAIQAMIDGYKAQLDDLDELAKSIFLDMFGDPVENKKGWNQRKIGEICEVTSSKRIYQSEQTKIGVPFYRIGDFTKLIKDGVRNPELYISIEKYNELKEAGLVPLKDDILLTSRGTLGLSYIVTGNDRFYFQDGMITWLKNIHKEVLSIFIGFIFKASLYEEQIKKMQNGSTIAYLSISMIKAFKIIVPPIILQQQFAAKIEAIETLKEKNKAQLADAEQLMAERMQYYFS